MKKLLTRLSQYYHYFFLGIVFLVTIFLLFLIFPGETRFKYEFQKGSPWRHSTLIAPFNFAVLKSDAAIAAEKDSVLKKYIPYFKLDTLSKATQLREFEKAFAAFFNLSKNKRIPKNLNRIPELLEQLYNDGILPKSPGIYNELSGKTVLMVVRGNQATREPIEKIHSLKSAYQVFNDSIQEWTGPLYNDFIATININDYLQENLVYDTELNNRQKGELLGSVSLTLGAVQAGERIIFEGDLVGQEELIILESLKKAYETKRGEDLDYYLVIGGKIILIIGCLLILFLYLLYYRTEIFYHKRQFSFIFLMIVLMVFLSGLVVKMQLGNIYMVPLAVLPILVRIFFDSRTATFALIVTTLLIGFFAPNNYEYIILQIIAGVVAVFSLNKLQNRAHLVITAFWVAVTYSIMYIAISLMQEGNLASVKWAELQWFGYNALLIFLTYPLTWVFEKAFGFVSDLTLMELSNTNQQPLLRKLAEEAPGTFQHSMQIANLAEEVIHRIGGNPFLVRAGALYHDIGKIKRPAFFIENQEAGMNPHDRIDPKRSAEVVIDHVTNGVRLARKHGLPQVLIDFILTHHGTTQATYFYKTWQNENPGQEVNTEEFSYPGPIPTSKECAVVMLTDGIEAAARSLKDKTYENLHELIENMVNKKIQEGQLQNAELTFREITVFKETVFEKLKNIYHLRIEYPK
ncbi:MAG: HDIG domain-containing protein [Prolixibacteraceae bacterium]|jgi:putative nucleotidyltransferase with HDIG domain|nr:HDIG domain-containing protein [Prolixibacteraceae bacterium]